MSFDTPPCTFASLSNTRHNDPNPQSETPKKKKSSRSKSATPRIEILRLGSKIGSLCTEIVSHAPLDDDCSASFWSTSSPGREKIYIAIAAVFANLVTLSNVCDLDLQTCILKKIELNRKKYPVEQCKGKSGKYTEYSSHTGITKENQSTLNISIQTHNMSLQEDKKQKSADKTWIDSSLDTVPAVTRFIRQFSMDREWGKFHSPRNITLAMMGEMGELAELFQWIGDKEDTDGREGLFGWEKESVDKVQQELADVAIYCLRLADVVGIHDVGLNARIQLSDE